MMSGKLEVLDDHHLHTMASFKNTTCYTWHTKQTKSDEMQY